MVLFRSMILILTGIIFLGFILFVRKKRYGDINKFLAGFTAGILLQAIILCVSEGDIQHNIFTYIAMFLGMGICIIAELWDKRMFCWIFPGMLAGAILSQGNLISLILAVFSVVMLVAAYEEGDGAGNSFIFFCILLFFTGEVFGYGFKIFLPALMPVFFSFGSGASIYICSEQIFPESEKRILNFAGGIAGFIFGMILYFF